MPTFLSFGGGDGAEVIYALRNSDELAKSILEAIGNKGQNTRKYYQRRLPSDPSKDYYFMHRNTGKTQPVIVEYGFLDSSDDDVSQLKNNILDYAEGVVMALANYAGVNYVAPEGSNVYVVKAGDSLWSIANNLGITVDELKAANPGLTSNILKIGQVLNIPVQKEVVPSDYLVYVVQQGDSLYSIANEYGISVNDIIELNNLSSTSLSLNQQLLIPSKEEVSGNVYTVENGDSLWSIANKYNITVDELTAANPGLTSNILTIGQQIIIPTASSLDDNQYIVKLGDSLWSIANKYDITVDELKSANNLTNNVLSSGQVLNIPEKLTTDNITYVVKPGDSLWSISKKYGITVDELKSANNLTNNSLSLNQKLIIPTTENFQTYVVKSGDSLWSIANKYSVTVDKLKNANNLTSSTLSIGQTLIIPV